MKSRKWKHLMAQFGRPACLVKETRAFTNHDEFRSVLNGATHLPAGESWPLSPNGVPMIPIAQLDFRAFQDRPLELRDVEGLTLFLHWANSSELGIHPGEGWLLKTFAKVEGLAKVQMPEFPEPQAPPVEVEWADPRMEVPYDSFHSEGWPEFCEDFWHFVDDAGFERDAYCTTATKLGGFARPIHGDVFLERGPSTDESGYIEPDPNPACPELVFQLASMPGMGFTWKDGGSLYLGRGTGDYANEWFFDQQS